jgi:hypothetical protein
MRCEPLGTNGLLAWMRPGVALSPDQWWQPLWYYHLTVISRDYRTPNV